MRFSDNPETDSLWEIPALRPNDDLPAVNGGQQQQPPPQQPAADVDVENPDEEHYNGVQEDQDPEEDRNVRRNLSNSQPFRLGPSC